MSNKPPDLSNFELITADFEGISLYCRMCRNYFWYGFDISVADLVTKISNHTCKED